MPVETTDRTASPAIYNRSTRLPHREYSSVLHPSVLLGRYGAPGKLEETIQKHWTTNGAACALEDMARDCEWTVVCPLGEDEEPSDLQQRFEAEIERTLREAVINAEIPTPGNFGDVLGWSMRGHFFGFAPFVRRWVEAPECNRGVRLELFPLHWSTIHSLQMDYGTGQINGVVQSVIGNRIHTEIEGADLVWLCFGDWPTGNPRGRALIALIELVSEIMFSMMTEAQHDSGFVTINKRGLGGESGEAKKKRRQLADHITEQTGLPAYVDDAEIKVHYAGQGMDKLGVLRYVDERIQHLMDQTADSLGVTAVGSRALGDTKDTSDTRKQSRSVNRILGMFASVLFPWFADEWGYNRDKVRMPLLEVAAAEEYRDPAKAAGLLVEAMQAGVERWPRPIAVHHLRENVGVPDDVLAAWEEWADAQAAQQGQGMGSMQPPQPTAAPRQDVTDALAQVRSMTSLREPQEHTHGPLCGCLADRPRSVLLVDYDGQEFFATRPFLGRFEEVVSWAANAQERAALDERAVRELGDVQQRHVDALRAFLERETPGSDATGRRAELDRLREQYSIQYAAALTQHSASVNEAVRAQGAEERTRQQAGMAPEGPGASPDVLRSVATEAQNRTVEQAQDEGRELARATQHEMVSYWRSGGDLAGYGPRRVTQGVLNRSVQAVGNAAESMGRVTEASRNAAPGDVLHGIVRSALMDACDVCSGPDRDGKRWDLTTPEGVQEFRSDRARLVPDPMCRGTEKHCRCELIPVWGAPLTALG